jgi:DNA invertase Pin-like site-specific DNA recombinase
MPRRLAAVPDSPRRAVLYVRVSAVMGRGDDFHSPDMQVAAMRQLIARRGMTETAVVSDIDRTGRDFNRDGIRQVLDMAKAGTVDVVALYDLSRLGRNTGESLRVITDLRALGVDVASTVEQIDDTPEGQFMLGQFLGLAQLYSDQMGRRWRQVAQHRAEQGLPIGGTVPIGYRRSTTVRGAPLEVDPETAPLVVELFERYAAGVTGKTLCADVTRRRGRPFRPSGLRHILENTTYLGRIRLGGRDYPGQHPPIVDEALFARVQRRIVANRAVPRKQLARMYPLTGLVVCAHCDGPMNHHTIHDRKYGSRLRLECRGQIERGTCAGPGMPPAADVEAFLLDQVRKRVALLRVDDVERAAFRAGRARARTDATRLRKELAETETALGRLAGDLARRRISEAAHRVAAKDLEAAREQLAAALEDAEASSALSSPARMVKAGEQLLALWPDASLEERNRMLRAVIRRVRLRRSDGWREPVARRLEVDWQA